MQKKKSGVKKCLEILPLRGGGGGRLMANAILNFHFDFPHTSLMTPLSILVGRNRKTRLNVNGELSVSLVAACDSSHIYSLSFIVDN